LLESQAEWFGGNFSRLRQEQLLLRDGQGKPVTAAVKTAGRRGLDEPGRRAGRGWMPRPPLFNTPNSGRHNVC
jgi:hypothetical protein